MIAVNACLNGLNDDVLIPDTCGGSCGGSVADLRLPPITIEPSPSVVAGGSLGTSLFIALALGASSQSRVMDMTGGLV